MCWFVNWLNCGILSENVANQETDELVTAERDVVEAFGEDGSHDVSQEHLDVAPTSFVEPEMDNTLQVDSAAYYLNQAMGAQSSITQCLSHARISWESCSRKGIWRKTDGMMAVEALVTQSWQAIQSSTWVTPLASPAPNNILQYLQRCVCVW